MTSSNHYEPGAMQTNELTMFGMNFADGRIKGYGLILLGCPKLFYVMYVRGKTGHGVNKFTDKGDGTITDAQEGPYSIKLLAEDAVALLDALKIDKVHFAGLSMGGMIGQYLGANHPKRI